MKSLIHLSNIRTALRTGVAIIVASTILLLSPVTAFAAVPSPTDPPTNSPKDAVCQGLNLTGGSTCGDSGAQLKGAIAVAVNLLSVMVGIAAIIMLIVSGLRFITSSGEAAKVTSAKNGIVYALIGIAVVVLAQFIVRFVFNSLQ